MRVALLWLETAAVLLLLAALMVALVGRVRRVWLRWLAAGVAITVSIVPAWSIYVAAHEIEAQWKVALGWSGLALALATTVILGSVAIACIGWRTAGGRSGMRAVRWPAKRLAVLLQAAVVLQVGTVLVCDAAVKSRMRPLGLRARAQVSAAAPTPPSDEENALTEYSQAWKTLPTGSRASPWPPAMLAAIEKLHAREAIDFESELTDELNQYASELAALRAGSVKPVFYWPRDYATAGWDTVINESIPLRQSVDLLALHARRLAAEGELSAALADVRVIYCLAQHMTDGPFTVHVLLGAYFERLACETLEAVLSGARPTAEQLQVVALDPTLSYRGMLARTRPIDAAIADTLWADLAAAPFIDESLLSMAGSGHRFPAGAYRILLADEDLSATTGLSAALDDSLDEPYWLLQQRAAGRNIEPTGHLIFDDAVVWHTTYFQLPFRGDQQRRLAIVALAMHGYRLRHGQFPETLDELAADNPELPLDDLFSPQPKDGDPRKLVPITLQHRARGWLLYSIGPDMTDDGGTPLGDGKTGDMVFEYRE